MAEAPSPEFFPGLAWAVPRAFASALAGFRFEQGDVLYPDASAYQRQRAGGSLPDEAIQVLDPPRGGHAAPSGGSDRRQASWASAVELQRVTLADGRVEAIRTTQGRLLMLLWSGEPEWLDPARPEPAPPRTARDLAQALDAARPAFEQALSTRAGVRFLFVVDLASDASRVKALEVERALAALGPLERVDLEPGSAGLEDAGHYHPTLVLRGLAVKKVGVEAATAALRAVLYGGTAAESGAAADDGTEAQSTPASEEASASADDGGESGASRDRFSVARHGLLEAIGD